MPCPTTEALNDDLKEIRADLHRMEVTLTAEIHKGDSALATEMSRVNTALAADIHKVDTTVAKLADEFNAFKWLLGATLATALSGVVSSACWAGSLSSRVVAVEGRLDKIDARLDKMDTRLDRIEASITKAIGRSNGTGPESPAKR